MPPQREGRASGCQRHRPPQAVNLRRVHRAKLANGPRGSCLILAHDTGLRALRAGAAAPLPNRAPTRLPPHSHFSRSHPTGTTRLKNPARFGKLWVIMGLEKIVYVVVSVIAGIGFVGFVHAKLANRLRHGPSLFALFLLGVVGLLFWSIFVGGLKDSIAEAVVDGRDTQNALKQVRLAAQYRHDPPPKAVDTDLAKIAALKQALHTARLFGWSEKDLTEAYHKNRQGTGGSDR